MARVADWLERTTAFFREVQVELGKVHWPTWRETYGATIVVLIVTLLMATYLGLVDFIVSKILQVFLS